MSTPNLSHENIVYSRQRPEPHSRESEKALRVQRSLHPGYVRINGYDYPVAELLESINTHK